MYTTCISSPRALGLSYSWPDEKVAEGMGVRKSIVDLPSLGWVPSRVTFNEFTGRTLVFLNDINNITVVDVVFAQ